MHSTRFSRTSTVIICLFIDFSDSFNLQGSCEPRRIVLPQKVVFNTVSIHKALASLDMLHPIGCVITGSFNPQGSREPRRLYQSFQHHGESFNPQGSREPRPAFRYSFLSCFRFQSTRLSRASTLIQSLTMVSTGFQSTRLSRASTDRIISSWFIR